MKPFHIALGVALVVAAGLAIFGDRTPVGAVVGPANEKAGLRSDIRTFKEPDVRMSDLTPAAVRAASTPSASASAPDVVILRLEPREALIADGSGPTGEGATAFGVQNWTPPPLPPPLPPPPPPPMAPALPFAYLGKAMFNGEWEVFLTRGDQTLIIRNKMVIDGVYRVESIDPPGLTLTYLPLKQVQQLNIGVRD
jgi:hypothetical protein